MKGCMKFVLIFIGSVVLFIVFVSLLPESDEDRSSKIARECNDEITAYAYSAQFVRAGLKAPSTAEIASPSNASIEGLGDCTHLIVSYVDAQNSFGAKLRNYYFIVMRYEKNSGKWYKHFGPIFDESRTEVLALSDAYREGSTRVLPNTRPTRTDSDSTVFKIQELLKSWGLLQGQVDGIFGEKTRQAIRDYQELNGLPVTGKPSEELLVPIQKTVNNGPK